MFKEIKTVLPILLCVCSSASASEFFNAKTLGSAGVGVAGTDFNNGAFLNPALVNIYTDDSAISLNASVGLIGSDDDELLDNAEDLEDELDDIDDSVPSSAEVDDIVDLLNDIDGAEADFEFGSYFQIALPNKYVSLALFVNLTSDTAITTEVSSADIAALNAAADTLAFDSNSVTSEVLVLNATIAEYGVALGKTFSIPGANISIGISPKLQDIDIYDYVATVDLYDEDDFDSRRNRSSDTHFNADVGLHIAIGESFKVGAVLSNINEEDFDTEENRDLEMETRATAGFAYQKGDTFVEVNVDLDDAKDFVSQEDVQILRVGSQLDVFNWAKLRLGYKHDFEDHQSDLFTLGFGFRPRGIMSIDVAGIVGENETYGGVVQFNFDFM